jgi:uncharacterized protein YjaZ
MGKTNLLLTTANGNLSDCQEVIETAVKEASKYAFVKLKIDWDINVLVTNRLCPYVIPEDGVGGVTHTDDFIEVAIDDKKMTKNLITEVLVHEFCHAARWGYNDEWANLLFDNMVNEGIATYFEAEFVKDRDEKQFFLKTILSRSDIENEKILKELYDQLLSNQYDHNTIFYDGNDKLPRWSGYSLGYYFVKKYLEKTSKKIEDAFADKYIDFRKAVL